MEIEKSQDPQERERSRNIVVYQELAANEPAEAEKQLQFLLDEKWQHRKSDVEMVMTLIESRSNIYMHGPNGSGKTTFVHDCFKTKRFEIPYIYIDTIEFYSEKLIAISISQQINGILQSYATQLKLKKALKKRFGFKVCKSFSILLDALLNLQKHLTHEIKEKYIQQNPQLNLLNPFFYVVLDNVKSVLKIEKQKKIVEKLCITQSLINAPSLFSVMVINDSLCDEIQIFKENTNVFQEYMFTPFYFSRMNEEQLKAILWESMSQAYGGQCEFLFYVWDNYFLALNQFFKPYTSNINEYVYLFRFLYPRYIQKFYDKKNASKIKDVKEIIQVPGAIVNLFDKTFKLYLHEIQGSLYMHMSSMTDMERETKDKKEAETVKKCIKMQQQSALARSDRSILDVGQTYQYDQITYLQDYKKNANFSYMQSMVLIAAFIAGSNKESTDLRLFEMDRSKFRSQKGNANQIAKKGQAYMLGKTRRFSMDRLSAILDYLTSLEIEGAAECQKVSHTADFYACVNSLVVEELLRRQVMRTAGSSVATNTGGDELINIGFKCNFDRNFVEELAQKIDFHISDYLFEATHDD